MPRLALALASLLAAAGAQAQDRLPLGEVRLPPGFTISVYASGLAGARELAFSDSGALFVGSWEGRVYEVPAGGGLGKVIADGLDMPVGVAFYRGDLYISSIYRVVKLPAVEAGPPRRKSGLPPRPVDIIDSLPRDRHHGWKFIKVGPDGKLYVPVGAPCNVCDAGYPYASILRMDLDGRNLEVFATGVRNTVGFDWDPRTGELWFTDNGRDLLGDDVPPDELNRAPRAGLHFGFPYLHGRAVHDPRFWASRPAVDFRPPELELPAHVAALGMRFYTGRLFPAEYRGGIFIAEHGSWNRSKKIGYRVSFVRLEGGRAAEYRVFAQGWLQGQQAWGRPADVEVGPDGALYVSDDTAGVVYRIGYGP
jgi:glucose/arabinose dehydrogenase